MVGFLPDIRRAHRRRQPEIDGTLDKSGGAATLLPQMNKNLNLLLALRLLRLASEPVG
jgi:hypothetical protein